MLRKALLFLVILLGVVYLRHLWFVNINAYLSGGMQQFSQENVGIFQRFFASISWVATLEKVSHFLFFFLNLGLTTWFLKILFTLSKKEVLFFGAITVLLFVLATLSFLLFAQVDFVQVYAKWLVVRLQSPMLYMFSFFIFYLNTLGFTDKT